MKVSTKARHLLELKTRLSRSKEVLRTSADRVVQLQEEKESLRRRVAPFDAGVRCAEFYRLDYEIRQLKERRELVDNRRTEHKTDIETISSQIQALKMGNETSTKTVAELEVVSAGLSASIAAEQSTRQQREASVERTAGRTQRDAGRVQQLAARIERERPRLERLKKLHEKLTARRDALEKERRIRHHKLTTLNARVLEMRQQIAQGQKGRRQMVHDLQCRQLELSRLRVRLMRLRNAGAAERRTEK